VEAAEVEKLIHLSLMVIWFHWISLSQQSLTLLKTLLEIAESTKLDLDIKMAREHIDTLNQSTEKSVLKSKFLYKSLKSS
jgi:hypothetical protein